MKSDAQLDAVLQAAMHAAPDVESALDDADLLAWRDGRLDPEGVHRVEAALAASRSLRALARAQRLPVGAGLTAWASQQTPGRARPWRLALAAAVLVGLGLGAWALVGLGGPAAPNYVISALSGGVKVMRAAHEPDTGVFVPDSIIRVDLKPSTERTEPPVVHVFVGPAGGSLRRVMPAVVVGLGGAFRVQARAGDVFGETPGRRTLAVALGPWRDVPSEVDSTETTTGGGRQWLQFEVDYRLRLEDGR